MSLNEKMALKAYMSSLMAFKAVIHNQKGNLRMAKIIFTTVENDRIELEATSGTVMSLAVDNFVEGIEGSCKGVCSCATCHVYVKPEQMEWLGQPSDIEQDMLELKEHATEYSRLCCQIEINDGLDGLELSVAEHD